MGSRSTRQWRDRGRAPRKRSRSRNSWQACARRRWPRLRIGPGAHSRRSVRTGDQSGMAGGGASSSSGRSRPRHTQSCRRPSSASKSCRRSHPRRRRNNPDRGRSGRRTGRPAMRPFLPSSLENHVTFSVHIRSAVSRSRQLRADTAVSPPTVLPVTSQASETQGL